MKELASVSLRQTFTKFLFTSAITVVLSACTMVTVISDYDEQTDKSLTALQQTTDAFFASLLEELPKNDKGARSEKNSYKAHEKFYSEVDEQLRKIEFRTQSIPRNAKSIKLVSDIRQVLLSSDDENTQCTENGFSLQDQHCMPESRERGPSRKSLEAAQRSVNQTIGAALALELAKKQGLESNK